MMVLKVGLKYTNSWYGTGSVMALSVFVALGSLGTSITDFSSLSLFLSVLFYYLHRCGFKPCNPLLSSTLPIKQLSSRLCTVLYLLFTVR